MPDTCPCGRDDCDPEQCPVAYGYELEEENDALE